MTKSIRDHEDEIAQRDCKAMYFICILIALAIIYIGCKVL
jgi:hypothetical protein